VLPDQVDRDVDEFGHVSGPDRFTHGHGWAGFADGRRPTSADVRQRWRG
jgi:hypothetical protein